ncbi:nuclear transport factor 2 family protein [Aeromicrobium sp. 9AM]|uniref:nuclear transport factor 2 family protein n=1 Tax=Aeromicrobium sp. 9AM TaxID=2653126 RepID=UPI0012F3290C|nr:nuclear transport factor 2 family protein [Aeromicrobium sp. 9AM]VXB61240.1 Ketosteroid isomerase homolog [Aeromicrobium sp. 9AM]
MTDISAIATLIATDQIRALLVEYAQCADTGRTDRILELFAPDAVLEATNNPACHGRDEIRSFFERVGSSARALMDKPYMRHHLSSIHIELDGPADARATSYFFAITDTGPDNWGRYRDILRHDGESWTIHHRRLQLEGYSPGGWMDRHEAARDGDTGA